MPALMAVVLVGMATLAVTARHAGLGASSLESSHAFAEAGYRITHLSTDGIGGSPWFHSVQALNNAGVAVGVAFEGNARLAVRWVSGVAEVLPGPFQLIQPMDITDDGSIAGFAAEAGGNYAVVYRNGSWAALPGLGFSENSQAMGITPTGVVLGNSLGTRTGTGLRSAGMEVRSLIWGRGPDRPTLMT